jgi:DNA-directed RNA polymerase specialized sigma24 family protein
MTEPRTPLTVVRRHLAQLSHGHEGDLALGRFAAAGLEVEGAANLSAFLKRTERSGRGAGRAELIESLVALAPADEIAALGAVVAMAPELSRMARLLCGRPLDAAEAESEMVAIAWELVTWPRSGTGRWEFKALCNAIWTQARRSTGLRRGQLELVPIDDLDMAAPEADPLERWPGLLAAAVSHGVLTPRQVVLIAQTRMEERLLTEVAALLRRPYDAVRKERERAEAALRAFALRYHAGDPR